MFPAVCNFFAKVLAVCVVQLGDVVDVTWALRDQGTLDERGQNVGELVFGGKLLDIADQLILGDTNQRVFDPMSRQGGERSTQNVYTYSPVAFSVNAATLAFR